MTVWLVWENAPWQGDLLLGVYSTLLAAETRMERKSRHLHGRSLEIEEVTVDSDVRSWHGN